MTDAPARAYPGGVWWPVDRATEVAFTDTRSAPHADADARVAARWCELCAHNPRLFNGPVAAFESYDGTTLRVRRDDYRRFAVQPEVDTGVFVLAVTGLLEARDPDGTRRFLIARRGAQVHAHPGLWETAPSGTVPPPERGGTRSMASLAAHLADECREELGFEINAASDAAGPGPVLMVRDDVVRSIDVVFHVEHPRPEAPRPPDAHAWEYDDAAWATLDELARFDDDGPAGRAHECIPPVRAIVRWLCGNRAGSSAMRPRDR